LKLTVNKLKGIWGTLLMPIMHDDAIDYHSLGEEIDCLISASINGIYSNGTAGEFYNQKEYEFDRIQELLAEKCGANILFQIGVS
jgi:4-hydroxy-tetrahydrodipicolinate synthase